MSKTRDNIPELDYFELRRRHEEYKRARSAQNPDSNAVAERLERQVAQRQAQADAPASERRNAPVQAEPEEQDVQTRPADAFEEAIEENYEAYEDEADDMDYDAPEDDQAANPNPFDSFIRFFNSVKEKRGARRGKGDELDDLDDLTDEELAELEAEELDELEAGDQDYAPAPARARFSLRKNARDAQDDEEIDEEDLPAEDVMDIDDPAPRASRRAAAPADEDFDDLDDEDFEGLDDEELDDEDFDEEDDAPRKSGFKKFVNLFVTRVDEEELSDEDEDFEEDDEEFEELDFDEDEDFDGEDEEDEDLEEIEEEPAPARRGLFSRMSRAKARRAQQEDQPDDEPVPSVYGKAEGGQSKMDEMKKPAIQPAAEAGETSGMSRRERRELAMRLAAEEAARKVEEEARKAEEEAQAAPPAPLFEEKENVDMAAFENAPETDVIVETTAADAPAQEIDSVDEPTREFTPVSLRENHEPADKSLFGADDEDDEDFDDEDDDEDEIVEKKPRFSLFGRKKRAKDEDEDDEDDFDDEDEDVDDDEDFDDEDDDEDEIVEKKPRRGLFGRKKPAKVEEDDFDDEDQDDEDFDDEEDSYDEDEDDEYDEYDDDEDDEDDYDDDEEDEFDDDEEDDSRRSFGHHLIGVFKAILGIILVLLVVVIGLNFHYYLTGSNAIIIKAHEIMGESSAFDVLCFSYSMRENMPPQEADAEPEIAIEPEVTPEPVAVPQADAEVSIPSLDDSGSVSESVMMDDVLVIDAAEAPAANNVG